MSSAAKDDTLTTHLRLPLLCLLISLFVSSSARGVDPNYRISQYAHTTWRIQDGFLNAIPTAITQTLDGYIWIGTQSGLVRFDGVRFVPWTPPDGEKLISTRIDSLMAGRDGSLWIGTAEGLSHWQNNHLFNFEDSRGVVPEIIEARAGTVWIILSPSNNNLGPLCEIVVSAMRCHGKAEGIPEDIYDSLMEDDQGNLWLGGNTELVSWKPDSHRVYAPGGLKSNKQMAGFLSLAASPDGSLWAGMAAKGPGLGLQRLVHGAWTPFTTPEFDGAALSVMNAMLDRQHALWVGTIKQGMYRIYDGKVEHFDSKEGLSSDFVRKIFEDHEGNVWALTSTGVDSFRSLRVVSYSVREGLSVSEIDSILAARDGAVWIGGSGSLDVMRKGRVTSFVSGKGLPGDQVTSLFEDHAGRFWIGIDRTLTVYSNGKFRQIIPPNGGPTGMAFGITEDVAGDIWVEGRLVLRIKDMIVQDQFPETVIPDGRRIAADPEGGIWVGLRSGDLASYRDGILRTFPFHHTYDHRGVEQIMVTPDGTVLGATTFGLIGWRHGKQSTLTTRNGLPCDTVYAFVFDDRDHLWLNMQCGIVEIANSDLQRWWEDSDVVLQPRLFDVFDGALPGRAPFGSAAKTPDGRVWFADGVVLQMVDPNRVTGNQIPPPVHIEGIVADRRSYSPQDRLFLPPLTRDLEIDFTALSFVAPQKVRFRYKLEGRDTAWMETGTRRQAFYTDLRPGKYRFRVVACNNDGVWNEEGDTLDFAVSPAWYQTNRFLCLCLVTTIFIFWALYRLRVRQVARTISARFDERLAERTRLAREIHDTLVQTIQGSKMVADDALDEATDFPRMRQAMERLSVWLGQATDEGRAALNSLRTSTTQTNDLAESFRRALNECRIQGFPDAVFVAEGKATEMHPIVRDEIYRIGYEAIRNACQHSEGTRLEVQLSYLQDLTLRITDNGKGIASDVAAQGKDGHYGLQGMRERASRISGSLSLKTSADSGTEIELIVPGHIVFRSPRSSWSPLFTRMKELFRGPLGTDDTN